MADEKEIAEAIEKIKQLLDKTAGAGTVFPERAQEPIRKFGDSAVGPAGKSNRAGKGSGYAIGTLSAPRGTAWVGERGPELVEFSGGERVYTATQSAALAGTAGERQTVQVVNYNRIDASNLEQVNRLIELLNGERIGIRMGYAGR